jgi:hypothetical protein
MTNLAHTSIPSWVLDPAAVESDITGTSYLLVGVGDAALPNLARWRRELAKHPVRLDFHADMDQLSENFARALEEARVGVRVRISGTAGVCLKLRAVALAAGLEDDEITVAPGGMADFEVFCTHCRAVTNSHIGVGGLVACIDCGRNLVIYHHVSRRSGQLMGFMTDAEVTE